jgi:hypothetical protein
MPEGAEPVEHPSGGAAAALPAQPKPKSSRSRAKIAVAALLPPSIASLLMSADTSYRFVGDHLGITDETERMVLCGVAEAGILGLTVYAWATRNRGAALAAYALVLVQAFPAYSLGGGVGGTVRVVLGPVLLAFLLHLLLGIEVRLGGELRGGLFRAATREVRERLVASLGLGRRGADSAAIARSRAADRVVRLVGKVEGAKDGGRRQTALVARLADALDASVHGLGDRETQEALALLVERVKRRKSVRALARIDADYVWGSSALAALAAGGSSVPAGPDDGGPAGSGAVDGGQQMPAALPPGGDSGETPARSDDSSQTGDADDSSSGSDASSSEEPDASTDGDGNSSGGETGGSTNDGDASNDGDSSSDDGDDSDDDSSGGTDGSTGDAKAPVPSARQPKPRPVPDTSHPWADLYDAANDADDPEEARIQLTLEALKTRPRLRAPQWAADIGRSETRARDLLRFARKSGRRHSQEVVTPAGDNLTGQPDPAWPAAS